MGAALNSRTTERFGQLPTFAGPDRMKVIHMLSIPRLTGRHHAGQERETIVVLAHMLPAKLVFIIKFARVNDSADRLEKLLPYRCMPCFDVNKRNHRNAADDSPFVLLPRFFPRLAESTRLWETGVKSRISSTGD